MQREALEANGDAVCHVPYTRWAQPLVEPNVWQLRDNQHPLRLNCGGTFFYSRALWHAINGNDTDTHPGEDKHFGHKVELAGGRSIAAPSEFAEGFLGLEWGGNVWQGRLVEPTFEHTDIDWRSMAPAWVQRWIDNLPSRAVT